MQSVEHEPVAAERDQGFRLIGRCELVALPEEHLGGSGDLGMRRDHAYPEATQILAVPAVS
jgi:hypothetical protein